jgi:exopolysaccharide biosynthesis polyprenyl glycosylphosphotransferase
MASGLRYRALSVGGTIAATAAVTTLVNTPAVQQAFSAVPYLGRPAPAVLSNGALSLALVTTVIAMLVSMWALFKPEPRRTLDTLLLAQKRVVIAFLALATLGYFDYSFRLPRSTLLLTAASLFVVLPLWMVVIRRRPARRARAVLVGDDPETMRDLLDATDLPVIGYVAPPSPYRMDSGVSAKQSVADGGIAEFEGVRYLGGLSRLDEVIRDHDVDTVLVAFAESDRAEFFGTLATCHDYGVSVQAHRDHADQVLTQDAGAGPLVDIDLEPWDWQDHVVKRAFDVAFAGAALLVLSPVILVVAAAIKLDSSGPLFYSQERTAEFGETFTVYKFRSMVPRAEADTGVKLSEEDAGGVDPRVTRVGQLLRRTHLDEIPQLWAILTGDMSVVGPRPERPELDADIETGVEDWPSRWFVKPGLTGLAQINGATGHEPDEKLRYDLTYIRRQSFWFDLKIVVRQVWMVLQDVYRTLVGKE